MDSRKQKFYAPFWLQIVLFALIVACMGFLLAAAISSSGLLAETSDVTCRYVFTEEPQSVTP